MWIVRGSCEVAISKADLTLAMRLWSKHITMAGSDDFRITALTLHPSNKYVLRMTIEPPEKVAEIKEAVAEKAAEETV